ncbi:MAG TPA: 1-(5-phosphoribosyl)-5-[(5-phosphoribosylamino)methylideneamino]imidazole-4-carboxamide isomerase [Parafilimonas sp.]|nr:1-(5-phosphoribosyl)-5-[(5-phosphoribosylamino)methylideneamino]imidazole-4-carboxamide isomerase [Parafilimonas sp.]
MIEIIPAIDIINGKCVRLSQGDFETQKIYRESPVDIAKGFEEAGIKRLHIVDLDGAKKGSIVNIQVLENIASQTSLKIDFGGGIKTTSDAEKVFSAGASIINIGSIAIKQSHIVVEWIEKLGAEKILLGADVKDEKIVINGWQQSTEINIINYLKEWSSKKMNNIFCTDVSKDGLLQGASVNLYKKILEAIPGIHLTASGGVSSIKDVEELEAIGCSGVIIGKALYEGKIKLNELKKFIS